MTHDRELDVRTIPKPQRHSLILAAYNELDAGHAILLTNDHEPRKLRDEFERELPGSFTWESLGETSRGAWQVRIVRVTSTPLPRIVADTAELPAETAPGRGGSVWQLSPASRDLDANVITVTPDNPIEMHIGPDLDVLIHILTGSGTLETETGEISLAPGGLIWLPRRSLRRIVAHENGLQYLSVHQRKPTLNISPIAHG
ncbi:MAG: DUF2249 domain-containing protein [Leucobacter sp.]